MWDISGFALLSLTRPVYFSLLINFSFCELTMFPIMELVTTRNFSPEVRFE
jgi:hypothetical protein